jgi:glycosyltransferase involved in cell wall biosynthesis
VGFEQLRSEIRTGRILARALRYREASLAVANAEFLPKPLFSSILVRMLSRGPAWLIDGKGNRVPITTGLLARRLASSLRDAAARGALLRGADSDLRELETPSAAPVRDPDAALPPIYLRTDLSFGIVSGGSVGHIGGVLNNLDAFFAKPLFITSDPIPGVRADLPQIHVQAENRFFDFRELPALHYNRTLRRRLEGGLPVEKPAFLYHRYCLNNYMGPWLARRYGIRFVLEFNGSEVWVGRNWGKPLAYEALSQRIERLNLSAADLVVVVSQALKDTLVREGVDPEKILVNPNGVDESRYSPEVSGAAVRARLGLEGKLVAGFIGTFGQWHGAEMLAEAFGRLLAARPDLHDRLRLLMIGDGLMMPQVKRALARHGIGDGAVLTGLIPQSEGPAHLAACDILVSPHVPNADGTPFFGSPTKLFEYMAMGKGIVASDLDQIGEVLSHDRTAWMVKPGDADSLAQGILVLAEDQARRDRLGRAAREEAVAHHTWREHTRKIVARLGEICDRSRSLRSARA